MPEARVELKSLVESQPATRSELAVLLEQVRKATVRRQGEFEPASKPARTLREIERHIEICAGLLQTYVDAPPVEKPKAKPGRRLGPGVRRCTECESEVTSSDPEVATCSDSCEQIRATRIHHFRSLPTGGNVQR